MGKFTKSVSLKGKYKGIIATEEGFMDDETGEAVDLCKELHSIYGDTPIELTTNYKSDEDA